MSNETSCYVPETLAALKAGQESAYDQIYNQFAQPVTNFLTAIIRNRQDALELCHDIFLSLWIDREKIRPERGIKGFLYQRAKQLAMNYFDRKKVRNKYESFLQSAQQVQSDNPHNLMVANETRILIELVIRGMSEQRQTIYHLRYDRGEAIDQIARQLGLSEQTVKNNLSIINKSIRETITLFVLIFG